MAKSDRRRILRPTGSLSVALVVGTIAVSGVTLAGVATADSRFVGNYTVAQTSFTVDPQTGTRVKQPERVELWIVNSNCATMGCTAHVVRPLEAFDMVFDGTHWNRTAPPPRDTTCPGAGVSYRPVAEHLKPQGDGTLSETVASQVLCGGVLVEASQTLTVTPSKQPSRPE